MNGTKKNLGFVLKVIATVVILAGISKCGELHHKDVVLAQHKQAEQEEACVRGTSEEPGISQEEKLHRTLEEAYAEELQEWHKQEEAILLVNATHKLLEEHPSLKSKGFMEICKLATHTTDGCEYTALHLSALGSHYIKGEPKPDPTLTEEEVHQIYEDWLPGSGGVFAND